MTGDIVNRIKSLSPTRRDFRNLGLVFMVVLGVIAALGWWKDRSFWPYLLAAGLAFGLWGWLWPQGLRPVYYTWMGMAIVLGQIVSRVLLVLLYYLVLTPTGLLLKLTGRDPLGLKKTGRETYWRARAEDANRPERAEKMY